MPSLLPLACTDFNAESALFQKIADDLRQHGWSVNAQGLSSELSQALYQDMMVVQNSRGLQQAGVGRHADYVSDQTVRRDAICWIEPVNPARQAWVDFCARLQVFLNRQLLLGLFSFESHFAHYAPGAFYRRHVDAFRGQANRVLSVVTYLNANWQLEQGGELVIYEPLKNQTWVSSEEQVLARVPPQAGTLVIFLSEEFPHEVLPATHDRYSIAGWFRVNTSVNGRIDPPA